jgi:UDP-glucose 4-epimerase
MTHDSQLNGSVIAGGAGFIGPTLVGRLLDEGRHVFVFDNFTRGKAAYLDKYAGSGRLTIRRTELASRNDCESALASAAAICNVDEVWHLAANSDIPAGIEDPDIDFTSTFQTTFELLRAMQPLGIRDFHFASSSAVYGDFGSQTLHEGLGPLFPISNYGAMKLASEAQASAAAERFLRRLNIFRFPNVVGIPATHGVILDFIHKLAATPDELHVLGDGSQQKSYLHVSDLVAAMLVIRARERSSKTELVNIGASDAGVTVKWIAEQVVLRVNPSARIVFGSGSKGWIGDVPRFSYSSEKMHSYGWAPAMGSEAAVLRAIDEIARQESI